MNLFFVIVFGIYFTGMLLLIIGWQESFAKELPTLPELRRYKKITIVIPFRNEEAGIAKLIQDLRQQRYESELLEVILIDDHSTDLSASIITQAISRLPKFRLLSLPQGRAGKKQSITYGIEHATGEIIVTTDADCRLSEHWLSQIQRLFNDEKIYMVFGGVRIEQEKTYFSQLQALEFCSLIGTGAATAGLGFPILCNGANLAFLKSAFMDVVGYEGNIHVPSGDDEFLMMKIDDRFPGCIRFLPVREGVVTTQPQPSGKDFLSQRLRWAGKWKHNTSLLSRTLAVFVLVFQASFAALWLGPFFQWIDWRLALVLFAGKSIFEFVFLAQVGSFLQVKWKMHHFFALQFVYPFYVVYVGVASLFMGDEWKGRSV